MQYKEKFDNIKKIIENYGNENYNKIKDIQLPEIKSKKEFNSFISQFVKKYNIHTNVINIKKLKRGNKLPIFEFNSNIGYIELFSFNVRCQNSKIEQDTITNLLKTNIDNWLSVGMKSIIIDLREHNGGSFMPVLNGLSKIFISGSLFGIGSSKVEKNENKWISYVNEKIRITTYIEPNLIDLRIAVLVNSNTASAGEFIALCLKRPGVKFFGEDTRSLLSFNNNYNICSNEIISLTNEYPTSINLEFLKDTKISVDHFSTRPKLRAKQWLTNSFA
jgi:C-terminal processing protease CtpA/Prc